MSSAPNCRGSASTVRPDVETAAGRRLSIVTFRDGGRELAVADPHDPDRAELSLEITDDEATALSEVLGGSVIMTQLAGLRDQVDGLSTSQIPVRADSPYAGRPLGATRARTLTRCSIVAVVRAGGVVPAPGPDDVLSVGDSLVAIGTARGLEMLARIIEGS